MSPLPLPSGACYCGDYICDIDVDNWASGMSCEDKQHVIDKVEQWIDKALCGLHFGPENFDIKINGNNKNRIFVPLHTDIISVTHVYISCIELPASWYTWDKSSVYLDPCQSGEGGYLSPEMYYILSQVAGVGIFPRGYNNIWIQGTMGEYPEVPEPIKNAAIILAKYENDPSLYTTALMKSEKIGDYSYTLSTGTEIHDPDIITGILEADMYLRLYVNRKPKFLAP